ncbi:1-acyl-sn-glycerol-3-phosphate acyltransferase [Aquimarina agarivorans]|uniref:1-acyl-sn-glycerol-3-phosphate acyltransferase n=1 Tax=Aquimarina agarivorans TaxID=980584 RepID=UPI000248E920|nr:1-acyl-sn-glycerol-3-phosphate acyltransferase [Aquimarina agarivorans]
MITILSRFILFQVLDWKIVGNFPKDLKKYVVIGAPHTSNMDFIIGLLVKTICKTKINFVGKKSLFRFPFGIFFRSVGGVPVNRKKNEKLVDSIVNVYNERTSFILAISPEGTRDKVEDWKTGFYYIAKQAKVPVVALTFDFGKRQTEIFEPFYTTDNKDADFKFLKSRYIGIKGKVVENSYG